MVSYKTSFERLITFYFAVLIALFTTRIIEFSYIYFNHFIENKLYLLFSAILVDIKIVSYFTFLFLPFSFLPKKAWFIFSYFFGALFCLINVLLMLYFVEILEPLDNSLFKHTLDESLYVMKEFGSFSFWQLTFFIPLLTFVYLMRKKILYAKLIPLLLVVSFTFQFSFFPNRKNFDCQEAFFLAHNKLAYFVENIQKSYALNDDLLTLDIEKHKRIYQNNHQKNYTNPAYPLLHSVTKSSALSPYFNLKSEPPNFVFIIVESLSAAFSGKNAHEVSLTPFLDSLANNSLVFHRFLSVGERTFSVLPSSLGSLPHGEKGFLNKKFKMPYHTSLLKNLTQNGYDGVFFYGGYAHYSFYDVFMRLQGVKTIYERAEYNYEGTDLKLSHDDIPFGVDDREVFEGAISALDSIGSKTPYFHTYLTLSMHFPFRFSEQEKYIKKLQEIVENHPQKEKYLKYSKSLSTVVYTDDVIKDFINKYKKRPEFENTIFVIFGDHRISTPKGRNSLDTYHVPLIIYSPLLNKSESIYGVNTHNDIAPSFGSLLSKHFNFDLLNSVHWLGNDFDMSTSFNAERKVEFMLNNTFVEQYLHENLFYSSGELFKVNSDFTLSKLDKPTLEDSIKKLMNAERIINRYVVQANKIYPELSEMDTLFYHSSRNSNTIHSKNEYKPLISYDLEETFSSIEVSLEIPFSPILKEETKDQMPMIVITVQYHDGKEAFWTGYPVSELLVDDSVPLIHFNHVLRSIGDLTLNKGDKLKVYFWNKELPSQTFVYNKTKLLLRGNKKL